MKRKFTKKLGESQLNNEQPADAVEMREAAQPVMEKTTLGDISELAELKEKLEGNKE